MRLDLVIDPPGTRPAAARRLGRRALRGAPGRLAAGLAAVWPWDGRGPLMPALYRRCMDAAVLSAYSRGLADSAGDSAEKAEHRP
jgi:hypothetical protein